MPIPTIRRYVALLGAAVLLGLGAASLAGALRLPDPATDSPPAKAGEQTAVLAGGCFWGVEAVFRHVDGVISATSGYAGGSSATANYPIVSTGATGHAESVRIVFDPAKVSYGKLLQVFFSVAHDPTQLDRQGPDSGRQYRSEIFYANGEQERIARAYIDQLTRTRAFPAPIVTRLSPPAAFYPAEAYHQNYAERHPHDSYIVVNDQPKVEHLKSLFPALYRAGGLGSAAR
ncbi:MAG: peptide-methionine (S)-S-oxide reductase MsrA [Sulfuricella sp.]|nr:peptide-methionine (S)-S-oxide reductase MsrA [Sulfuricella sp.]